MTVLTVLVGVTVAVGVLDIATGPDIGMSLFYLIPISVAAFQLGLWPAVATAFAAAATWLVSDVQTASYGAALSLWNAATRLFIFAGLAVLLDRLRRERDRLRSTVAQLDVERLRQSAFVAALYDPILVVDASGTVSSANERASELFGRDQVVGRWIEDLMPFVGTDTVSGLERWAGRLTDPTGHEVEVEVKRTRATEQGVDGVGATYVVHDITHHAQLDRMREQLLYSVAHELRGPLGVLENALDLIATEYADLSAEEFGRLTGSAQRTAHKLRLLMEDLLSAGSIQSGRFTVVLADVPLREIVDEALETVELTVEERGQRVDAQIPASLIVRADRRYARQVMTNLLANASKYGPHGTPITVRAEGIAGEVRVTVEDRGRGIAQDELTGLFERFYRVRKDPEEPGVGLGLAIAKGIVEAHGGRVGVDSEMGRGTKVWFTLPAALEATMASRSSLSTTTVS